MPQVFLMMMCTMKYGVFVFFGVWQTIALIFTALLVPETRGVPIEKVGSLCTCPHITDSLPGIMTTTESMKCLSIGIAHLRRTGKIHLRWSEVTGRVLMQ